MKALVGAFNQEKALVGVFSVIVQPVVEPMEHCTALKKCCGIDIEIETRTCLCDSPLLVVTGQQIPKA